MTVCSVKQDLGSDVVWCPAYGLFALAFVLYEGCETKVADLDVLVAVEKYVAELEIAMDDLVGVHIMAGAKELHHEEACLWLGEASAAAKEIHEGASAAELESHVHIVFVFETFEKINNVGVFEHLVYPDFGVKLGTVSHRRGNDWL